MPKAAKKNSKAAPKSGANQRRNEILEIVSRLSSSADICRSIAEECVTTAAETYEQRCRDNADRHKAATEILLGFQHFAEWCLLAQDSGEPDCFHNNDVRRNWNAEAEPSPIAIESWSASNVEIRKAVKKQSTNELSVGSTPSIRKSKVIKHRSSKRQSQTLLPFETTVMIEKTDREASADMTAKRKAFEKKLKTQSAAAASAADKPSANVSTTEKKAMPEHNRNYTYDSSGKRIKMNPLRPEKIRTNIVTPVCTVITEQSNENNQSQPQSKTNRLTNKKKTKKSKNNQNKLNDAQEWKHSSVPLQPPPSKVIQLSEGVKLESDGMRINGPPIKKTTQNMNRTEYLQYLEAFRQLTDENDKNESHSLDVTNIEPKAATQKDSKPAKISENSDADRNVNIDGKSLEQTLNNTISPSKAKRKAMIPSKKNFHASKPINAPVFERNRAGLSSPLLSKTLYNELQSNPETNDNKDAKIRKSKLGKVLFG